MTKLEQNLNYRMIRVGCWVGIVGALLYLGILSLPFPDKVVQIIAIFLGPIQIINSLGVYYYIRKNEETIYARYGLLFNVIGATLFTTMVITQFSVVAFVQDFRVDYPELKDALRASSGLGNIIQLGLDITFDTFISLGTAFLALGLTYVSRFPAWLGITGLFISAAGLSLNLFTFPYPPAESGYFDPGPFYGLFVLIISIIILIKTGKPGVRELVRA